MVVKVYISGISGNKEVKKRQQRVLLILDSRSVKYEVIDIAEPGNEEQKDFMQNKSTSLGSTIGDPNPRHSLPPQIFNDEDYCGDYDQFDMANEIDEMDQFLKLAPSDAPPTDAKLENGNVHHEEPVPDLPEEEEQTSQKDTDALSDKGVEEDAEEEDVPDE